MNSLRHTYAGYTSGLKMTDCWKNIETIKVISKKDWMRNNLRMKDVNCHIRKLGIDLDDDDGGRSLIENSEESKRMRALLEGLENLSNLFLQWGHRSIDVAIIISHLTNVTTLKLWGVMRKCPSASILPPNLSHLILWRSSLIEDPMQELSKQPKLSYLKLKYDSYYSERMQVVHDGFPSLRGLSLQRLFKLTSLDIEEGGMPHLKLLRVDSCPRLDTKNMSNKLYELQIVS